ncbi:hypothetical protein [Embleya sp. AB8]|uniref:hypothetical protein n=1 Tax=Embleya sp. AB8 TaxID=3156304 RepID=UPI003C77B9CB
MRTLLLFDGLGSSCGDLITLLREQYARPENRAFFAVVCDAVESTLEHVGADVQREFLPTGLPLRTWLRAPDPPTVSPVDSITAGVCTHALQLCHLQPARPSGREHAVAALGLSLGLQAAIVAGMGIRRPDAFLELCDRSLRLVVLALVRGHQLTAADTIDPEAQRRYTHRHPSTRPPTPMAAVTGVDRDALTDAVAGHNASGDRRVHGRGVEVALVASPRTRILSGRTEDLLDFHLAHERFLTEAAAGWTFLRSTLPFHNTRLAPVLHRDADDLKFVGTTPTGERLRIPVHATDTPRNLQESTDLNGEFLNLMMVRPVDWPATVAHVMDACRPDRVVDFGPGPAARVFTRECLPAGGPRPRFQSGRPARTQGG